MRFAGLLALPVVLAACPIKPVPPPFEVSDVIYQSSQGPTPPSATYPIPSIRVTFDAAVDSNTLSDQTISLVAAVSGERVPIAINIANFPNSVTATPTRELQTSTRYTFKFSSGIKSSDGRALTAYDAEFTVRAEKAPPLLFEKRTLAIPGGVTNPTSIAIGPDGKLYVAEFGGQIRVVTLKPDRSFASLQVVNTLAGRAVLGIAVRGSASAPEIWASHSELNADTSGTNPNLNPYAGKISKLTGPSFSSDQDVITGIPRSAELHQNNGIAFKPGTDELYITVGGNTNHGGKAEKFANRPEALYGASILVANVGLIGAGPVNIQPQGEGGNYTRSYMYTGPASLTAQTPVKVYATGLRNPYDLTWTTVGATAGRLYATDNGGNAGYGETPGTADNCPGPQTDPGTVQDELNLIVSGGFYGHPNPARGQCAYNAGPGYQGPAILTGLGFSTDGVAEFDGRSVGNVQVGDLLYVNFASGDSLFIYRPSTGQKEIVSEPFSNPLDVAVLPDAVNGSTIFVAEFGASPPFTGTPAISYLVPK